MRARRRVDAGVGQEVDQDLAQPRLVSQDQRRLGLEVVALVLSQIRRRIQGGQVELPLVVGARGARIGDRVQQDTDEIDLIAAQIASGVQARQEQQILHESAHPQRFGVDPLQGVHGLIGQGCIGPLPSDEFGVPADRGQRGAQLVGGVGHELAHLRLAVLTRRQSVVDVPQQSVERRTDLPDLSGGGQILAGDALVDADLSARQRLGGDALGRGGDPLQGGARIAPWSVRPGPR